jgi:hypothetical protein
VVVGEEVGVGVEEEVVVCVGVAVCVSVTVGDGCGVMVAVFVVRIAGDGVACVVGWDEQAVSRIARQSKDRSMTSLFIG